MGTGTVAGNAFTPGDFTIHAGDSVKWTVNSDEVHTVTFGENPSGGPPPTWPPTFNIPPGPPAPVNLGPVDYTGAFIHTGIIVKGSTLTVHFTQTGDFTFKCEIHPGMAGTVHVVTAGASSTSQADADQKASATQNQLLGQVTGLRAQGQSLVTSQQRADGTTLWKMPAGVNTQPGPVAGGGTGYLEILEFMPQNLPIKAGDTVQWQTTAPHTVTFLAAGQTAPQLEGQFGGNPLNVPPAKPSESYDGSSLYHSGVLSLPGAPSTFQLTFPSQGQFSYRCLLHDDLGMTGTIAVAAATPSALPASGGPPGDESSTPWTTWVAIAGALTLTLLGAGLIRKRATNR